MHFVIETKDFDGKLGLRQKTRPTHLDYLQQLGAQVALAGPFLNEKGEACGSLIIVEAETLAQAEQIAAKDPYALAGLFETTSVRPWRWVINAPEDEA